MNIRFEILMVLVALVTAEPARASSWLNICTATDKSGAVQIKDAKTGEQLLPLKSGDFVYQIVDSKSSSDQLSTFVFRRGKFTEIAPKMEELETKHLVNCEADEPKRAEYPIMVRDNVSEPQLIYDEFGFTTDFFTLNKLKLGKHSACPVSDDVFVSESKRRELESKGVPLARFCAAMTNNSWFWFDPETGQRRPDFQIVIVDRGKDLLGPNFFFKPIPCFLAAGTGVNQKTQEIRPADCMFRYSPLTGAPLSEEEGRALAKIAVFSFGPGEKGGTLDDTEGLSKQSARRLSAVKIKAIKDN